MNIKNTYFGFTSNIKGVQKARIEDILDREIRHDGEYKTQKEMIYDLVKLGYTPDIEEDYVYYKRNGELSKPKTLYTIKKDNSFYDTNKTLNNFATYLLDNNFLDDQKAKEYIQEEQQKIEEAVRLEAEEKERIRIENEHKRKEQEQQRQERLKNNLENGMKFVEERELKGTITEITRKHWNELKEFTCKNFEGFMSDVVTHFAKMLHDAGLIKDRLQYLIHDFPEYNTKRIDSILEEEVLKTIFSINNEDSKQTITAKVKAYYENREYRGGNTKEVETGEFYYFHNKEGFKKVFGERWNYKGFEFFVYQNERGLYVVTELKSGASLVQDISRTATIKKAKEAINNKREMIEKGIENCIRRNGISPNVKEEVTV